MNDRNHSDYNEPRTDLNRLLPETNISGVKLLEGLNHNLFNRFFTKDEVTRIVGIIGSASSSIEDLNQVVEPNPFLQENQLQPVVYNRVGNVDWFLTFADLLTRLRVSGVNTDRFNEWGNSLQFNWVPPIDLDKLINYQDYFWESTSFSDPPQYVTIKNRCNWVNGRIRQTLNSIANGMPQYTIVAHSDALSSIMLFGDVTADFRTGEPLVLSDSSIAPLEVKSVTITYDGSGNVTLIGLNSEDYGNLVAAGKAHTALSKTEIPVTSVRAEARSTSVDGDLTEIFISGYVFSSEKSTSGRPLRFWTVETSEVNIVDNVTTIVLTENIDPDEDDVDDAFEFDWERITVRPVLRSLQAEQNVVCSYPYSRTAFALPSGSQEIVENSLDIEMGEIIWARDMIIRSATTGVGEGTTLGSVLFTDGDGSKDFTADPFKAGDTLRIATTAVAGDYIIAALTATDQLTLDHTFFEQTEIPYEIIRRRVLTDIESATEPTYSLIVGDLWFDTTNDQLLRWNGAIWDIKIQGFSHLVNITNGIHLLDLPQNNGWVDENKWLHITETLSFSGKQRAQQPIIEFFPNIRLAEHSHTQKAWGYRRNTSVSYATSTVEPTLFELLDIKINDGDEISLVDPFTVLLHHKYGNLSTELVPGTEISFRSFGLNTVTRTVASSDYLSFGAGTRYVTRIVLDTALPDYTETPPSNATISPVLTAHGDAWLTADTYHWEFRGFQSVTASSYAPVRNPMLDEIISYSSTATMETVVGLYFQEFKLKNGEASTFGQICTFDSNLHDLCLFEDYQEGDIRVYFNGVRQYGTFNDIESTTDANYVGGIIFDPDVELTDADIVRVELGEYDLAEIGKRAVLVNTPAGLDLFNLVDNRRLEQIKNERTQYPWFSIYDIHGTPFTFASNIFRYQDSLDGTYLPAIDQRVNFDEDTEDYDFEQYLRSDDGELYSYYDASEGGNELQTIWKHGINNEQFVPTQENGFWVIPNQFYYNVHHENRKSMSLSDIFTHFNSIIMAQTTPGILSEFNNTFHVDAVVNYGLGGSIKEHNDGFDTLISSMLVNNSNPLDVITFANAQYDALQRKLREILESDLSSYLNESGIDNVDDFFSYVEAEVQSSFEKNDRLDQWFGDSTAFDLSTSDGVKNWIATVPFLGLAPSTRPHLIHDEASGTLQLVNHDGHRTDLSLSGGELSIVYTSIQQNSNMQQQIITAESDPFLTEINGFAPVTGDLTLRINTTTVERKLYRYNSLAVWEILDIALLLAGTILHIEEQLFDILGDDTLEENFSSRFEYDVVINDTAYSIKIQEQFSRYVKENDIITPFENVNYQKNDPFTWNYGYTDIQTDPITGGNRENSIAHWAALYDDIYNTPYPHWEPWKLQGYTSKPDWWDSEYRDPTETRRWLAIMWSNILDGTISTGIPPALHYAPDGTLATGAAGQVTTLYSYIPVNIDSTPTGDGYQSDTVLPPKWDSNNTTNPSIRTPYDTALNEFIVTPSAGFPFGTLGPHEWAWSVSTARLYDELIVSFKLQPLKFLNQTFCRPLVNVSGLQVADDVNRVTSHANVQFHGDIDSDGVPFLVNGLNQWYIHFNRYHGFDGVASEFRPMWKDWTAPLTYQFSSFIDTDNFKLSSDLFDATDRDFDILFKKSTGIKDIWVDSLLATIVSTPSRYASSDEAGLGWTISFSNTSPIGRPILSYAIQNYPVRTIVPVSDPAPKFRLFSFPLVDAAIQDNIGFDVVNYSESLGPTTATGLSNDATVYTGSVTFNTTTVIGISVIGSNAQTFQDLMDEINAQFGLNGTVSIEEGNLRVASDQVGGLTAALITDDSIFDAATPTTITYGGTTGSQLGLIEFDGIFFLNDDVVQFFPTQTQFSVLDSTNFDGTYTIKSSVYDAETRRTRIEIKENIIITSSVIDGNLEPAGALTMPDEWVTGTGVTWSTNGVAPAFFNTVTLFYLIRDNDREFRLAVSRESALAETPVVSPADIGTNQQYIGRVRNNFKAISGRLIDQYWKQHYLDTRVARVLPTPITISGLQNIIDFLQGYSGLLEAQGVFYDDPSSHNRDAETGRTIDWQLITEKFIEVLHTARERGQQRIEEFEVSPDYTTNTFTHVPSVSGIESIQWTTGTRVTMKAEDTTTESGVLPAEFNNAIAESIPYYIIRTNSGAFQLAGTSLQATKMLALEFTDNGSGKISFINSLDDRSFQTFRLNPQRNSIVVEHPIGVLSNVLDGTKLDLITDQRVYDANNNNLESGDIIVSRRDLRTHIELSANRREYNRIFPDSAVEMVGMHLFFDGYEHILQFPNYSTAGILLYDPFLGINIPRVFLEFDRQTNVTFRPNVGGNVIHDRAQIQNIESAIDSLRRAYSTHRSKEGDDITKKVREALGYDGPFDYADDLGITDKAQFTFHRGAIQKKGTNFAANAFANQSAYDSLIVDEFWANHIAGFGDSKEQIYPELKLTTNDVLRNELRLEFLDPGLQVSNQSFTGIYLADSSRWYNHPDQVESLAPRDRFYMNMRRVQFISIDPNTSPEYIEANNNRYLYLSEPADAAWVITDTLDVLDEGNDFVFVTNNLIRFANPSLNPVTHNISVLTLTYSNSAQNPATIINREEGTVVTELPIWNPARQEYYSKAIYVVDTRQSSDPARYNVPVASDVTTPDNFWHSNYTEHVWFDTNEEGYVPYDDRHIIKDINLRLRSWGLLSDWGQINLYQWTESNVPPSEYDALALIEESDPSIPITTRKTGTTRKIVFRNEGSEDEPFWVEERNRHYEFLTDIVTTTSYTLSGAPLNELMEVYLNGIFTETETFGSSDDFRAFAELTRNASSDIIHLIAPATVPTDEEIDNSSYKLDTPYSTYDRVDSITGQTVLTYFFWVEDRLSNIEVRGGFTNNTTLKTAAEGMKTIPSPYMIPAISNIADVVLSTTSFSDILKFMDPARSHTESTLSYEFPFSFNQLVVKGLNDHVRADDAYVLRFTRDFTLRDDLTPEFTTDSDNFLKRKNVHNEWKLFRERQLSKIDIGLWHNITEALLGFEYDGDPLSGEIVPTPTPTVTPTISVTPSAGTSPTPTPNVTPTTTPSITPTRTPVPSITPSSSPEPGASPTPAPTMTRTPAVTPTETPNPTPTRTPVVSSTPPVTVTRTPAPSPTPSPSYIPPTPSNTPSNTPIIEPSPSAPPPTPDSTPAVSLGAEEPDLIPWGDQSIIHDEHETVAGFAGFRVNGAIDNTPEGDDLALALFKGRWSAEFPILVVSATSSHHGTNVTREDPWLDHTAWATTLNNVPGYVYSNAYIYVRQVGDDHDLTSSSDELDEWLSLWFTRRWQLRVSNLDNVFETTTVLDTWMVTGASAPSGNPSQGGTPGAIYMGEITLSVIDPWEDPANQPLFPEAPAQVPTEDDPPRRIWRYKRPGDPGYIGN